MKGAYVLLMRLDQDVILRIGALGKVRFPAGFYTYTGSSMVNLEKRVKRHFATEKRLRWHIDYFLKEVRILRAVLFPSHRKEECRVNRAVMNLNGGVAPVKGFGSSDCTCEAHLAYFGENQPHFEYPQERHTMHPPS